MLDRAVTDIDQAEVMNVYRRVTPEGMSVPTVPDQVAVGARR